MLSTPHSSVQAAIASDAAQPGRQGTYVLITTHQYFAHGTAFKHRVQFLFLNAAGINDLALERRKRARSKSHASGLRETDTPPARLPVYPAEPVRNRDRTGTYVRPGPQFDSCTNRAAPCARWHRPARISRAAGPRCLELKIGKRHERLR